MAALSSAILGAAIIGGGTALASGAMSASAAKKAGKQQAQAASDALGFQRQQYDNAKNILAKYGVQGDWARNQIAAFIGAPQTGAGAQGPGAASGGRSGADYASYVQSNPDLAAEWQKPGVQQQFGGDIAAYGEWHAQRYANENRPIPQFGAGASGAPAEGEAGYKTPDQLREEAMANYDASPWAKIAQTSADKAQESFLSMAGAQGGALSGRTARGLAEVSNEMKQQGFGSYMSVLGGLADTGFNADSGIASGGQTFANNASNLTMAAGQAKANATTGAADAWGSALSDAAGWAGWGVGQMGNTNTGQKVYSPTGSNSSTSGMSAPVTRRINSGFTLQ